MKTLAPLLALALAACGTAARGPGPAPGPPAAVSPGGPEAVSLLGEPLERPALDDAFRLAQQEHLREAREALAADPEDPEAWIWVGRRTAYLGRYREAVAIYTEALARHPDEPRLLRHRGHRYLTLRRLDETVADLERAAALTTGKPDRIEPDGLPNARGLPTSTLHFNIWYHLGLARYLQGDFPAAAEAYRRCLEVSKNPDSIVATTHWLTTTLRRLDRAEEAAELLAPIHAGMDVIENHGYHRLTLLYKAELSPEDLLADSDSGVAHATIAYGLGAWHLTHGRIEQAREIFRDILAHGSWAAFGHIAAEADLARLGPG